MQKLEIIVENAMVNLSHLQVKEVFQLNTENKIKFMQDENMEDFLVEENIPYEETIEQLKDLTWEQSPVAKIELIYQALKFKLAEEVDKFWDGTDRFLSTQERNIDMDNLQGITIYIVWALKDPTIMADLLITQEFLTRSTKLSTRSLFLEVLKSSIEYLLEISLEVSELDNPQENP